MSCMRSKVCSLLCPWHLEQWMAAALTCHSGGDISRVASQRQTSGESVHMYTCVHKCGGRQGLGWASREAVLGSGC